MHRFLVVASPVVVFCLALAVVPAAPQSDEALIERNEAAAIADLRTFMSAEAAYQTVNGGFYDEPGCLHRPSDCIPGYPAEAPTFLDAAIAGLTIKDGYGRAFSSKQLSPKPGPDVSPSSAESWAVILWPDKPGKTGRRIFCGAADGVICFTRDGSTPKFVGGRCPWEAMDGKPAGCEVVD